MNVENGNSPKDKSRLKKRDQFLGPVSGVHKNGIGFYRWFGGDDRVIGYVYLSVPAVLSVPEKMLPLKVQIAADVAKNRECKNIFHVSVENANADLHGFTGISIENNITRINIF
jgi:hypothetical protein